MAEVTCTKCRQTKPVGEFRADRKRACGISTQCRECLKKAARDYYHRTTGGGARQVMSVCERCAAEFTYLKKTGQDRKYCTERCKANAAADRQAARDLARVCGCGSTEVPKVGKPVCRGCRKEDRERGDYNRVRRLKLYGLTPEQFDDILAMQRGMCAICATDEPGARGWFVDHDHACCPGLGSCGGCVRGLLCLHCNSMLGHARDSVENLDRAKKYLITNSQFRLPLQVVRDV